MGTTTFFITSDVLLEIEVNLENQKSIELLGERKKDCRKCNEGENCV